MKAFAGAALADLETCYDLRCTIRSLLSRHNGLTATVILCGILGEVGTHVPDDLRGDYTAGVVELINTYFQSADEVNSHG